MSFEPKKKLVEGKKLGVGRFFLFVQGGENIPFLPLVALLRRGGSEGFDGGRGEEEE